MQYKIEGTPLPVVICHLNAGEQMITERGSMSWMSPNMKMETTSNGGIGKAFGRMFAGEALFQNRYTAMGGDGIIAFASSFPGSILPVEITPDKPVIVQKRAFLASTTGVTLSVFFQKKIGAGLFGGEGFIMQKLSGQGIAFIEIDGHAVEYDLAPGQELIVDTGYLAKMDATCTMDIVSVPGLKNMLFGGEGIFNTVIKGPGHVTLQTMPIHSVAGAISPYIVSSK
ncbi:MAG: TIGR00266 family protein [Ruminococcaceae bacterium]|nr:TIGR00266 family protein [Oscillospiraceae bacterium]